MDHSKLIKRLRLERGISQEKLVRGISQRSTLASFEKGAKNISYGLLVQYLDRMNVTLEEYQFLLDNEEISDKRSISTEFHKKLSLVYDPTYVDFLEQRFREHDDTYYQILKAVYVLVMEKRSHLEIDFHQESIKILSKYLDSIENWGRFELFVFVNTLYCYDDQFIFHHFKRTVKKMKSYVDQQYYSKDLVAFLINGSRVSFERKSFDLLNEFLKELHSFSDTFHSVDAQIAFDVFTFLSTNRRFDLRAKHELLFVLSYLGKFDYIDYIEQNITKK